MATRTFTIDELDDYSYDPVLDIRLGSGRWSEFHEIVFQVDDKLYVVDIEEGLTEYQDYSDLYRYPDHKIEDGKAVVECSEVEIYEEPVITRKWRPKK